MKGLHPLPAAAGTALGLWLLILPLYLAGPQSVAQFNGQGGPAGASSGEAAPAGTDQPAGGPSVPAPANADAINNTDQILNPNMYQGPFKENWLRVRAVQEELANGKEPPGQLNLVFQNRKGNFLYFYDMTGRAVKIRYRESKFDTDAIEKYKTLIRGHPYRVNIAFEGVELGGGKFYPYTGLADLTAEFKTAAQDVEAVLVFRIFDFQVLRLETIRF